MSRGEAFGWAVLILGGALLGIAIVLVFGPPPQSAAYASQHCASLDAIAVQTPEGWTCITTAVIPADSGTESVTGSYRYP